MEKRPRRARTRGSSSQGKQRSQPNASLRGREGASGPPCKCFEFPKQEGEAKSCRATVCAKRDKGHRCLAPGPGPVGGSAGVGAKQLQGPPPSPSPSPSPGVTIAGGDAAVLGGHRAAGGGWGSYGCGGGLWVHTHCYSVDLGWPNRGTRSCGMLRCQSPTHQEWGKCIRAAPSRSPRGAAGARGPHPTPGCTQGAAQVVRPQYHSYGASSWSTTATGREVWAAPRGTPTAQPHPTGSKLKLQPPTPHKAQPTPSCPRPHCQPAPRRAPPAAFLQGTAELRAGQGDNIGPMRPPRSQMCVNKAAAP